MPEPTNDSTNSQSSALATTPCSAIVAEAVERYNPSHVFGLLSGGHDSLCACHIASQHPAFSGCVHINTGIGIEATRDYVRETCRAQGWDLHEMHPPQTYESLVCDQGFPGPAHHWKMYQRLKERCLKALFREHRDPDDRRRKIVLISGRRRQESTRRMANCNDAIETGLANPSPRAVFVNPIIDWDASDKNHYIARHNLPKNPVVERLCMSGECLCGAFAKPGELDEIRFWYPEAAAEIDRIAAEVQEAGKHAIWGTRPPKDDPDQETFDFLPLCVSCNFKRELSLQYTP